MSTTEKSLLSKSVPVILNHTGNVIVAMKPTYNNAQITLISIYKLGDVGISSNLIGSLYLTNGHCPPPGRWIMKQWPA